MQRRDFFSLPAQAALLAATAWLAGCSTPKAPPAVTPRVAQDAAAAGPAVATRPAGAYAWTSPMEDAMQRLRSALGSPVEVSQTTDQRLWLSWPVESAFDKGRSAVKPQATAQLDQVALLLRANPRAQAQIVGDGDVLGAGAGNLALDRAASARDWIVARGGIVASRIGVAARNARGAPTSDTPRLDILFGERGAASTPAPR